MAIELCILASGSSGNCSIVRTPAGVMLIDAGIGPRTLARRLDGTGVRVADIASICLTHLDSDHFTPTWAATIVQRGIRVFCHSTRADELVRIVGRDPARYELAAAFRQLIHTFEWQSFSPLEGLSTHPIRLAHDELGSHGFSISGFGGTLAYATDLGSVPEKLIECFAHDGVPDVLALESNYDRDMQLASSRPWFLKQRIMSGRGHLSNDQAYSAVRAILDRCDQRHRRLPDHVVLLHRSQECNCPTLLRALFERDSRIAQRLTLAEPHIRTEWLRPTGVGARTGEQLSLGWA